MNEKILANLVQRDGFYEISIEVKCVQGLHFRPCNEILGIANNYVGDLYVAKSGVEYDYVDAKSAFSLLQLLATKGAVLNFRFYQSNLDEILKAAEGISKILSNTDA